MRRRSSRTTTSAAVNEMRHRFQQTMQDEFHGAVERLTGRRVEAFVSGNHVESDISAELFVFDAPLAPL